MSEFSSSSGIKVGKGEFQPPYYDGWNSIPPSSERGMVQAHMLATLTKIQSEDEENPYLMFTEDMMYDLLQLLKDNSESVKRFNGILEWLVQKCQIVVMRWYSDEDDGEKYYAFFTEKAWENCRKQWENAEEE